MSNTDWRFLGLVVRWYQRLDPATRDWLMARLRADDRDLRKVERYSA